MTTKRKAEQPPSDAASGAGGGGRESLSPVSAIEQQLCAHAAAAYNDFVLFFQRRTSVRLAHE